MPVQKIFSKEEPHMGLFFSGYCTLIMQDIIIGYSTNSALVVLPGRSMAVTTTLLPSGKGETAVVV